MFNSALVDVAIGLIISFLGVSLVASAITEAISTALSWRQNNLLDGIKSLLNDQDFNGLARDLYNHALVNPLASGTAQKIQEVAHKPAYIDSQQFALALYQALSARAGTSEAPDQVIAKIDDPQLRAAMGCLWVTSSGNIDKFKQNIAVWFDHSMDRASGWYKRRTQGWTFGVAFAVAALVNVNVLYETAQIWTRPIVLADIPTQHFLRDLEAQAKLEAREEAKPSAVERAPKSSAEGTPMSSGLDAAKIFNALEQSALIGWTEGPRPHNAESWMTAITSWFMVAGASLFGAAFWYDILARVTHLKGAGKTPEKAKPPQADT